MAHAEPQGDYPVLAGQRYLVFGAARSGLAAARLLRALGRGVAVRDEGPAERFEAAARALEGIGAGSAFGPASPGELDGVDALILSPGIPAVHPLVREARRRGIGVYSEIELGFACCPAPIVAVTGSNGKTTVTTLVGHFARVAGRPALEAGNIGAPLCDAVFHESLRQPGALVALEVSSFQLETIDRFRPKAAIVLNVTPDHLDRYEGSMEKYAAAKARIGENMGAEDALIVNRDDPRCLAMAARSRARAWHFSLERACPPGAWLSDFELMAGEGKARRIGELDSIGLRGMHNVSNILAAAAAATFLQLPIESIRESARTAKAPRHRLQFIAEIGGVSYYNDSKATNIDAVLHALNSFSEPIVLLAGGRDKNSPFAQFADRVRPKLKQLIVFGEAADTIAGTWGDGVETRRVAGMAEAVAAASAAAAPGDVVLLSPACASFDQYANYEERGDDFIARVEALGKGATAP